jgi:hypothetical protein
VNAIGNVGGFIGPSLIGFLKKSTGHDNGAFFTLAAMALAAAAIIASMRWRGDRQSERGRWSRWWLPRFRGWMLRGCRVWPRVLGARSAAVSEECVGDRLSDAAPG